MKTIVDELKEFFDRTGRKQADLAAASGVPASTICNLLKGKRKHLLGPNQDAVRKAMQELKAGAVGAGGVVGVDEGSRERGTKRSKAPLGSPLPDPLPSLTLIGDGGGGNGNGGGGK